MSKYTTELRYICEVEAGYEESQGYKKVDEIITLASPKVFDFDFEIFDEDYRLPLEKKILRHFYTREICEETYGLWKLRLEDKMNLIMPYFNKLYESAKLEFNPFYDVDVARSHSGSGTGASLDSTTVGSNGVTWNLYSDTPQGGINGITADEDSVANNTYLTDARKITNNDNSTTQGSMQSNRTEQYQETVKGKQGTMSYSKMLEEYRRTFRKIDEELMKELEPLFFSLWN